MIGHIIEIFIISVSLFIAVFCNKCFCEIILTYVCLGGVGEVLNAYYKDLEINI